MSVWRSSHNRTIDPYQTHGAIAQTSHLWTMSTKPSSRELMSRGAASDLAQDFLCFLHDAGDGDFVVEVCLLGKLGEVVE